MEEIFRSRQPDQTLIHRVVKAEGKFHVEFPVVDKNAKIDGWFYVGGSPGQPSPTYDTLEEAKAFIEGLENGMQGKAVGKAFKDGKQQKAYDDGLAFGLEL